MSLPEIPSGYRLVELIQREPPDEVLRHAEMSPGQTGRYGKLMRYLHAASQTVYEVLYFKAGRPPTREEVIADLSADVAQVETQLAELERAGGVGAWLDRKIFAGPSRDALQKKKDELNETIRAIQEDYRPGEPVLVP